MNRILSVVRSMTDKIIELSRAVVTAPAPTMGKVTVGWSRSGQRIDGHGGHVRWRGDRVGNVDSRSCAALGHDAPSIEPGALD